MTYGQQKKFLTLHVLIPKSTQEIAMFKRTSSMLAGLALVAMSGTAAAGVQVDVNIGLPGVVNTSPQVVYREVPVYRPAPVYVERDGRRFHRYHPRHHPHHYRHHRHWRDYR